MALFAKDPTVILQESLDFLKANTSITASGAGSRFRALLEINKIQMGEAYATFDFNVAIGFVYGANGIYLDYLGDIFGLQRLGTSQAQVSSQSKTVRFYTLFQNFGRINNNQDILIPSGTSVWAVKNGTNVQFYTTEDATLSANSSQTYVAVRGEGSGSFYNVPSGSIKNTNFTNYTDSKNATLLVTSDSAIQNGLDAESDDNYRYRIINQKLSSAMANETALRLAALSVPGVADVSIIRYFYGIGSAMVLIKGTMPAVSDDVLANVQAALDDVKGAGLTATAAKPKEIELSYVISVLFKAGITADAVNNARQSIKSTIADYADNLDIAQGHIINELANLVLSCDPNIISIGQPGKFFDKIYVTIPVLNQSITKEVITDYYPGDMEKLIIAQVNPIIFRN